MNLYLGDPPGLLLALAEQQIVFFIQESSVLDRADRHAVVRLAPVPAV